MFRLLDDTAPTRHNYSHESYHLSQKVQHYVVRAMAQYSANGGIALVTINSPPVNALAPKGE